MAVITIEISPLHGAKRSWRGAGGEEQKNKRTLLNTLLSQPFFRNRSRIARGDIVAR